MPCLDPLILSQVIFWVSQKFPIYLGVCVCCFSGSVLVQQYMWQLVYLAIGCLTFFFLSELRGIC